MEWLKIAVVTLLAPEWSLGCAFGQFLGVREAAEQLESARRALQAKPDWPPLEGVREDSDTGSREETTNNIMHEGERDVDPILPKSGAAEEGEIERPVDRCERIL